MTVEITGPLSAQTEAEAKTLPDGRIRIDFKHDPFGTSHIFIESPSPAATVRGAEEVLDKYVRNPENKNKIITAMQEYAKTQHPVMTKDQRIQFNIWLVDYMHLKDSVAWQIVRHVQRYVQCPPEPSSGYTLAQVSDAWDAGQHWEYAEGEALSPNPYPDKPTFLNSLKTPEIK
jgi:hypothetical protein